MSFLVYKYYKLMPFSVFLIKQFLYSTFFFKNKISQYNPDLKQKQLITVTIYICILLVNILSKFIPGQ